jgi:hypothetical protein
MVSPVIRDWLTQHLERVLRFALGRQNLATEKTGQRVVEAPAR